VLCTLIGIVRGQLTYFDGLFTLTVVHSPIVWYILWIDTVEVYSWWRRREKGIAIAPFLCFVLPFGWVSLNLVVWFMGRKLPGYDCGSLSFNDYAATVLAPGLLRGKPAITFLLRLGLTSSLILISSYSLYCIHYIYYTRSRGLPTEDRHKFWAKRMVFLIRL
jgi:hypothetical protein